MRSADLPDNSKPYPNFHACRIREPGDFDRFRTATETIEDGDYEGRSIVVLYGREKETGDWDIASYRFPVDEWSEGDARKWCAAHDGIKFEPAIGDDDPDSDPDDTASDTVEESTAPDTAERQIRLARARLAMFGIKNKTQ